MTSTPERSVHYPLWWTLPTILLGNAYVALQMVVIGEVRDELFVSLLVAGTLVLVLGMRRVIGYLGSREPGFVADVLETGSEEASRAVFQLTRERLANHRWLAAAAAGYGLAVGSAPWLLSAWQGQGVLRLLLAAFLTAVNAVTGVAVYSLVVYLIHVRKLGELARIDVWHFETPSAALVVGITQRVTILAAVYVSLSLSSVLFSVLPLGGVMAGYSAFAGIAILACLVIPPMPLIRNAKRRRREELDALNRQLPALYREAVAGLAAGNRSGVDQLQGLLVIRTAVLEQEIYPFRLRTVGTAVGVLLLAFLPSVLEAVLGKIL